MKLRFLLIFAFIFSIFSVTNASSGDGEGEFNAPTVVYPINPYNDEAMPTTYSATSSLLNVDTYSLSNQVDGDYYGFAESGMILKGETSGAQAVISLSLIHI